MAESSRSKPKIDADLVREMAQLLDETGLTEIEYGGSDWHLRVARTATAAPSVGAAPAPAKLPADVPAAPAEPLPFEVEYANHPGLVVSPMVGVVYTASEPELPPFVQEGGTVSEGQTILLIEAMKVFNPIVAPRSGTVARILVTNGAPVEYGEPLMLIE